MIRNKVREQRHKSNVSNYFFSSRVSPHITEFLIKRGVSANQTTLIFFCCGILGAIFSFFHSFFYVLLAYFFFRLHIVLDLCDGEISRYTEKKSINGSYWDLMAHSVVYPLYFFGFNYSLYEFYNNEIFLIHGALLSLLSLLRLSVRNNYHRALFDFGESKENRKHNSNEIHHTSIFKRLQILTTGYEGYLSLFLVLTIVGNEKFFLYVNLIYIVIFLVAFFVKFLTFSFGKKFI